MLSICVYINPHLAVQIEMDNTVGTRVFYAVQIILSAESMLSSDLRTSVSVYSFTRNISNKLYL